MVRFFSKWSLNLFSWRRSFFLHKVVALLELVREDLALYSSATAACIQFCRLMYLTWWECLISFWQWVYIGKSRLPNQPLAALQLCLVLKSITIFFFPEKFGWTQFILPLFTAVVWRVLFPLSQKFSDKHCNSIPYFWWVVCIIKLQNVMFRLCDGTWIFFLC